jgi:hypothetical protein
MLITLFHQNYCFTIFAKHQTIDLVQIKDSKSVILMKKRNQYDAEEEKDNKIQGFSEKLPATSET